jgi:hypothetical protein
MRVVCCAARVSKWALLCRSLAHSASGDRIGPQPLTLSLGFRPKRTPLAFARLRPSLFRSRINSRSNSTMAASMVTSNRPCEMVVLRPRVDGEPRPERAARCAQGRRCRHHLPPESERCTRRPAAARQANGDRSAMAMSLSSHQAGSPRSLTVVIAAAALQGAIRPWRPPGAAWSSSIAAPRSEVARPGA